MHALLARDDQPIPAVNLIIPPLHVSKILAAIRVRRLRSLGMRDAVPRYNAASPRQSAVACPPERTSGGRWTACAD